MYQLMGQLKNEIGSCYLSRSQSYMELTGKYLSNLYKFYKEDKKKFKTENDKVTYYKKKTLLEQIGFFDDFENKKIVKYT